MSTVMDPVANYAGDFARLSARGSAEPAWLSSVRRRAFDAFERRGFPTTRDEEWRSTSVAPIAETEFVRAAGGSELVDRAFVDACRLPDTATELVFVNGEYAASLSRVGALPQGVRVDRLTDALAGGAADLEPHLSHIASFGQEPFVAMNTALWTEGVVVRIAPKAVLASPIHLVFVSTQGQGGGRPTLSHPRVLIIAGVLSQVSVVETYAGLGRYFTNSVTEVAVADQAIVNHYKLQRESDTAFHIATIQARTGTGGSFNAHSMSFGGALVRNDIVVTLDGEGCQSTLDGLYVVDQTRLVDNHTTIDHAKPH